MSGSVWIASYVLLWLAVLALGATVLALLRQIGVLHARLRPLGGHPAGEGPEIDSQAPTLAGVDYERASQPCSPSRRRPAPSAPRSCPASRPYAVSTATPPSRSSSMAP